MRSVSGLPVLAVVSALLSGCGTSAQNAAPPPGSVAAAFKGSPPQLASLHAQANQLLGGGPPAFKARLASLHGYPVVINKWASWCGPCRSEFPVFQRVAVSYGRQVAFLGLNGKDSVGGATAFLRSFPITYPSYEDPHEAIAQTIQATQYYPLTVFIDQRGKIQFVHAGQYASVGVLEQDIRRYELGSP